jgi:hypothetical protein
VVPCEAVEIVADWVESALLSALVDCLVGLVPTDLRHAHVLQPLLQLTNIRVSDHPRQVLVVPDASARRDRQFLYQDRRSLRPVKGESADELGRRAQPNKEISEIGNDTTAVVLDALTQPRRAVNPSPFLRSALDLEQFHIRATSRQAFGLSLALVLPRGGDRLGWRRINDGAQGIDALFAQDQVSVRQLPQGRRQ